MARERWSKHVTETSNELDLESGVFSKTDPRAIARLLTSTGAGTSLVTDWGNA